MVMMCCAQIKIPKLIFFASHPFIIIYTAIQMYGI